MAEDSKALAMEAVLDLLGPALVTCPWCGGDGYLPNEVWEGFRPETTAEAEAFAREHGDEEVPCPLCGGQGEVAAEWVEKLRLGQLVRQWIDDALGGHCKMGSGQ